MFHYQILVALVARELVQPNVQIVVVVHVRDGAKGLVAPHCMVVLNKPKKREACKGFSFAMVS